MSKKKSSSIIGNVSGVGWGFGYVVDDRMPEAIVGRVMEIIEATGLPQKQEESVKNLIKSSIYNTFHEGAVYISQETHSKIREEFYKQGELARTQHVPMSAVSI